MVGMTAGAASPRASAPSASVLLWIAALVFAGACGGLALSDLIGRVSALWVANAILVYFLLTNPSRDWPLVLGVGLGANFAADLVMGDTVLTGAALTLCNAVGILIIAAPLRSLGLHDDLSRPKPLCVFYALALGPAPAASGLLSAVFFYLLFGRAFETQALDWYATDALGYSIVVPILMTVKLDALKRMFARDQIAVTLALLGVVAGTLLLNYFARAYPLAFLFFPAVILVTFQRGFAGGAIGLLMAAAYLMVPVLTGHPRGALAEHGLREQIVLVQVFIAVIGFSVVLVGAALEERRRLEQGLAAAKVRAESAREEALVARDEAVRANRLKSMFLATMSHELRTPLNAIIGFSELMNDELYGTLGDPRYREYCGLIRGAGHHLLSLINDVLDMSKIEAGKLELHRQVFDIREVVSDCLGLMRERAAQSGVALACDIAQGRLLVDADRRAMKQILLNLLSNAVKFTPEGGRVTVRAHAAEGLLALSVADTGIGIPADQIGRLGNPFVQIRGHAGASHEGTGLGLALVRALSEIHDGKLAIESVHGKGTTVRVTLPLVRDDALALAG
ncbi:MAG: MASE1 domain-containing protein [Alphaproteobacteria bacterium]|nr:MASE1 domain-containing protein [Alphaproteobacteria bacterium]